MPRPQPNILLICVDQWRADTLGCAGHPCVRTPHLDRLAADGIRFSNAYSATPTCVPARAALLTGLGQRRHGFVGYDESVAWNYDTTLAGTLAAAGYHTQCVGKMHTHPARNLMGFHNVLLHDGYLHSVQRMTDDYGLYGVVDYHILHRALVRAGVAAVATGEDEIEEAQRAEAARSASRHVAWMAEWWDRPSRAVVLLTSGLPGTGKSTVAAEAADAIDGVAIASDRVRKHLAGVPADAHQPDAPGGEMYSAEMNAAVYAGLLERAEPVIASGRPVILDATYSKAADRAHVRAFCEEHGVRGILLDVRCAEATTLDRLEARLADPDRLSDAGPAVYRAGRDAYESPDEWDEDDRLVVETDREGWGERLGAALRASGLVPAGARDDQDG